MATSALKKITTEAKSIRRKHPNMTWKAAIKKAGAAYRAKAKPAKRKVGAAKKKTAPKKRAVGAYKVIQKGESRKSPAKKVYRQVRSKSGKFKSMQTVGGMINSAKKMLVVDLGKLEAKKFMAKLKRDKTKLQKLITSKKAQLRRLK